MVTLISVYITIMENKKDIIEEKMERSRSYLDTFLINSLSGTLDESKERYKDAKLILNNQYEDLVSNNPTMIRRNKGVKFIGIKNCGPAIIKDIKVEIKNQNNTITDNFISRILINEVFFVPIVFENSQELGIPIDTVTITYKTLRNEIIVVTKEFYTGNIYNEEIETYKKYDYGYKRKSCKFTELRTF